MRANQFKTCLNQVIRSEQDSKSVNLDTLEPKRPKSVKFFKKTRNPAYRVKLVTNSSSVSKIISQRRDVLPHAKQECKTRQLVGYKCSRKESFL